MSQQIGILDWHQEANVRPTTFIPKWAADLLVSRLAAEKLSGKVIRRFAPDSVFYARQPFRSEPQDLSKLSLAPVEVDGSRFRAPSNPAWQEAHAAAGRSLQTRAYLTLKIWRMTVEAGAIEPSALA